MQRFKLAIVTGFVIGMSGLIPLAFAQTALSPEVNQQDGDDVEHGVARMSIVTGDVSVRRGDSGEVVSAELNTPLVSLDHVLTGRDGRTELQLDYANLMRVGPDSEVRLGQLRDNSFLLQIEEGTITYRILRDSQAVVEISTPTVSIRPMEQGTYRVTVRGDGSTVITVRRGLAQIYKQQGTTEVLAEGRTMEVMGDPANPLTSRVSTPAMDDWDRWNQDRDRDLEQSVSYKYVSRDISGAEDLDANGRWVYDAPYGNVWVPNVADGWAPYRVGRWVDVDYYGWTWLSGDPWGWAPYHYGSWYSSSYGWAWYPGNIGQRYHWRPALVGFFGWGSGGVGYSVNTGFGFGNVGWVPLAPFERYQPWYGRSGGNRTTIVNNINITAVYRNAKNTRGVTSMRTDEFGRRGINTGSYLRASTGDLSRAGRVNGQMPLKATSESHRFSDRPVSATAVSRGNNSRLSNQNANVSRTGINGNRGSNSKGGGNNGSNNNGTTINPSGGNGNRGSNGKANAGVGQGNPSRINNGGAAASPNTGVATAPDLNSGRVNGGSRNGGGSSNNQGGNSNNAGPNPTSGRSGNNTGNGNVDVVGPRRSPVETPVRVAPSLPNAGSAQSQGRRSQTVPVQTDRRSPGASTTSPASTPQSVQRQPQTQAPQVERRAPSTPQVQRAPAPAPAQVQRPPERPAPPQPQAPPPARSAPAESKGNDGGHRKR
ncbi:MAG: DUF6600 domain-containing protein [Acidobacteriota bacterium]